MRAAEKMLTVLEGVPYYTAVAAVSIVGAILKERAGESICRLAFPDSSQSTGGDSPSDSASPKSV
jgi:hypothetical protein